MTDVNTIERIKKVFKNRKQSVPEINITLTQIQRCIQFLLINKYKIEEISDEGISFFKDDLCCVDLCNHEIVLIDDTGDFLHLPLNYYTLIGVLIELRQLPINYKTDNWIINESDLNKNSATEALSADQQYQGKLKEE